MDNKLTIKVEMRRAAVFWSFEMIILLLFDDEFSFWFATWWCWQCCWCGGELIFCELNESRLSFGDDDGEGDDDDEYCSWLSRENNLDKKLSLLALEDWWSGPASMNSETKRTEEE